MENKTAEEMFNASNMLLQKIKASQDDAEAVSVISDYLKYVREKGIIEGFNAARETKMELVYERIKGEIELTGEIELLKYQDLNDYLNSKK